MLSPEELARSGDCMKFNLIFHGRFHTRTNFDEYLSGAGQ
jgi:hypothetical protein